MDEKEILELKKKIAASTPRPHPKKGEPGYDEFMRSIFKSAASNMLRDELENDSIRWLKSLIFDRLENRALFLLFSLFEG